MHKLTSTSAPVYYSMMIVSSENLLRVLGTVLQPETYIRSHFCMVPRQLYLLNQLSGLICVSSISGVGSMRVDTLLNS